MTHPRYTSEPIAWVHTGNGEFPYRAVAGGTELLVRVNDFPAEPLYTLLADGRETEDLEDWPAAWIRPGMPPGLLRAAGAAQLRRSRVDAIVTAAWAAALCLLPRGRAEQAVAALGLDGVLAGDVSLRVLEPPPPGTSRLAVAEEHGDVASVRVALTLGPTRSDLDALLGPPGSVPRVHYDQPHQLCYPVTVDGAPYTCDVFASFAVPPEPGARAERLVLRRQPG